MVLNPVALLQDKNKFGYRAQVYSWVLFFRGIYNPCLNVPDGNIINYRSIIDIEKEKEYHD